MFILPVSLALESNVLLVLTLMLILLPISFMNIDLTKGQAKFIHFFIPITIIAFCQFLGYKNLSIYTRQFNEAIKHSFNIDLYILAEYTILDFSIVNEYEAIKYVLVYLFKFFSYI